MVRFTSEILSSNIGPPLIIAALAAIAGHHLGRQALLVCVAPSPQQRPCALFFPPFGAPPYATAFDSGLI